MPSYLIPVFKYLCERKNRYTPSHNKTGQSISLKIDSLLSDKDIEIKEEVRVEKEEAKMDREIIEYDEYIKKERNLENSVTPEFISLLKEACKIYGWSGDYSEIQEFYWYLARCAEPDIDVDNSILAPYHYELPDLGKPVTELTHDELHAEWRRLAGFERYATRCKNLEKEIARRESNDGQR